MSRAFLKDLLTPFLPMNNINITDIYINDKGDVVIEYVKEGGVKNTT